MNKDNQYLRQYISTLFEATQIPSIESLIQFVERKKDIIEDASDKIIKDASTQKLSFDEAFVLLDGSKSLVTKNIMHRRTTSKLGSHITDFLPPIITPDLIASYLNARPNDVAIMSFHVLSGNRVGVFVVRKDKYAIGWPGIGGTVYNFTYLDGLKPEFLEKVKQYADSISKGKPERKQISDIFDFLGTVVFMLLFQPKLPNEIVFIPHKLFNILPLHAFSFKENGNRVYLHDQVASISYASSLQELLMNDLRVNFALQNKKGGKPHYLTVRDDKSNLPWLEFEKKSLDISRLQLEPQGVKFDIATDPDELPDDFSKYEWISWSSHARSNPKGWGDSYLILGSSKIVASSILKKWDLASNPIVVLAACETAIDTSGLFDIDEYCSLDVAFRTAGARAVVSTLWPVEDFMAAFTAMSLPAWWFGQRMTPDTSITGIQRHFQQRTWKHFLLKKEQLEKVPSQLSLKLQELQEPLWALPDGIFSSEDFWAVFRCHGY